MDKLYTYKGPVSSVTLPDKREVRLHPGGQVTLPSTNLYVAVLVAKGHLREVTPQPTAPPAQATTASATASQTPTKEAENVG